MRMEFATIPERGRINPDSVMLEMLNSFPRLLQTKGIEAGAVFFLEGEGCAMQFAYPGRMVAKASPFLRIVLMTFGPKSHSALPQRMN